MRSGILTEVKIRIADVNDAYGKGYVHYHSWIETYTGLIDQEYLNSLSLERCIKLARKHPENTFVALVDNKVIGFACYIKSRDNDMIDSGEITAIYVLKVYQNQGVGKALMLTCIKALEEFKNISLWVLKSNKKAIEFYRYLGFELDGIEKVVKISETTKLNEVRMVHKNNLISKKDI